MLAILVVACVGEAILPGSVSIEHNADWEPVIQEFDGVEMALVPAGCFMMGSSEEEIDGAMALVEAEYLPISREWFDVELPQHEVCFEESFWIDVYEVTNEQYGSPGGWSGDDLPREAVTWFQAVEHCESRGARLPTEAEWEYAARGPDGLIYPWGNEFIPDNVVYGGNSGDQTAPVGSRPGGVSWVGAYDMSGNVWEWTGDWYDPGYYASSPALNPQGAAAGSARVVRGGSWIDSSVLLRGTNRDWFGPDFFLVSDGFRCARSD